MDNSTGNNETPEKRRERLRKCIQEEKMKGTRAFNKVVAEQEGISMPRLKQILENTALFE